MKIKCNIEEVKRKIFGFIFALTIILQCRSMWSYSIHMNFFNYVFLILLFFSAVGYCFEVGISKKKLSWFVLFTIVWLWYTTFFLLFNTSNVVAFIRFSIGVWIIFFLVTMINYSSIVQLLICYENVVYIICIVSLLFWVFGSCLGILHSTGSILSYWTGKTGVTKMVSSYYGLYFEPQKVTFLDIIKVTRNCAIFTEAPMSSFHFCIAFLIYLFIDSKQDKIKFVVLLIGIISTFAVTGYICFIAAITVKFIQSKPKISLLQVIKIIIIPLLVICAMIVIQYLLINKLSSGTSGSTRLDDFRAGFLAWMNHPLYGNGFGNDDSYIKYMTKSARVTNNYGFSNSPMQILAYGGIYLAIPYVFCIIRSIKSLIKKSTFNRLYFFVSFLFLFIITVVPFQYLTVFLMLLFTKRYNEKDMLKNKAY